MHYVFRFIAYKDFYDWLPECVKNKFIFEPKKKTKMKKIILALLVLTIITSCQSKEKDNKKQEENPDLIEIKAENVVRIELQIGGMTCAGCENTISSGLLSLHGVTEVSVSHLDSNAIVLYDTSLVRIEDLKSVVEEKGYDFLGN